MASSDGGKGSDRRPGNGYQDNWDKIFGGKPKTCPYCADEALKDVFFDQTCEGCWSRMGRSAPHCTASKVQGKEQ